MGTDAPRAPRTAPIDPIRFDILLPSQRFPEKPEREPAPRLMIVVPHDALDCFAKWRASTNPVGESIDLDVRKGQLA